MESALYEGTVVHLRRTGPPHAFRRRLCLAYLDLTELERVFAGRWLWGVERRRLVSFRRADHLGDPGVPIEQAVRTLVRARIGREATGPVRLLTLLRTAGWVFNPVSFHYVFGASGGLEAVVADVSNTPWNERHCYVLPAEDGRVDACVAKAFHVSPFLPMGHRYRFRFEAPGERLTARIESFAGAEPVFDARLALERREIDGASLARALVRFPAMPLQVIGGIYWQALRLHAKGAPFHVHPRHARTGAVRGEEGAA